MNNLACRVEARLSEAFEAERRALHTKLQQTIDGYEEEGASLRSALQVAEEAESRTRSDLSLAQAHLAASRAEVFHLTAKMEVADAKQTLVEAERRSCEEQAMSAELR